jgi:hypothetical protein
VTLRFLATAAMSTAVGVQHHRSKASMSPREVDGNEWKSVLRVGKAMVRESRH